MIMQINKINKRQYAFLVENECTTGNGIVGSHRIFVNQINESWFLLLIQWCIHCISPIDHFDVHSTMSLGVCVYIKPTSGHIS